MQTYLIMTLGFFLLGGVLLTFTSGIESIMFFNVLRSPLLDGLFAAASKMAEAPGYMICALAALSCRWICIIPLVITSVAAYAVSEVLKAVFRADRPIDVITEAGLLHVVRLVDGIPLHAGPTSFPSGHSISAFAMAGIMIMLLKPSPAVTILIFAIAILAAVSRVYLVQHFWPDVYAGAAVGTLIAIVIAGFFQRYVS